MMYWIRSPGKEIEIEWIDDEKRQLKVGRISGD